MGEFARAANVAALARAVVMPPPRPVSHAEYCRDITIPDGPLRGSRYNPGADPVHAVLAAEISREKWQRIIGVGAVQTGKSLALILVPLLRSLTVLRQPAVYSQPTLSKLHEAWSGKLAPSIRESGKGGWLPTDGQGAKGGQSPRFQVFRDPVSRARAGTLYLLPGGGANESAQAAVTAKVVCIDEADSFPSRHRCELVCKRADSYGPTALRIITSTVKSDEITGDGASIILGYYGESTMSRLAFACPCCGHWQKFEFEQVRYEGENEPQAIATARYLCANPECGELLDEDGRQAALLNYRVVHAGQYMDQESGAVLGPQPQTVAFGLLWTALDSSLRSLGQIAAEHWRAQRAADRGDHGPMRSFYRDQLCKPYRGDIDDDTGLTNVPTRGKLAALSDVSDYEIAEEDDDGQGTYHLAETPNWVEHCTLGVDVQEGGEKSAALLYWTIYGRGKERGGVLCWGTTLVAPAGNAPNKEQMHAALDRLRDKVGQICDTSGLRLVAKGVDTGNGAHTEWLVAWLLRNPGWYALKGTDTMKPDVERDLPGWLYVRQQDKYTLRLICTNNVTKICHGELIAKQTPAPLGLPKGLARDSTIIRHICARIEWAPGKWTDKQKGKDYEHREYQKRNDYMDALAYARALSYQYQNRPAQPRRKIGKIKSI